MAAGDPSARRVDGRPAGVADDPLVVEGEEADEEDQRDQQVHGRTGEDHAHPTAVGLGAVGAGLVLRRDLLEVAHARRSCT